MADSLPEVTPRNVTDEGKDTPFLQALTPLESARLLDLTEKVFANPRRYGFASGDEAAEAFIRYNKRLKAIIHKSQGIGDNKEAYIDISLRFIARSVQRTHRKKEIVEYVLENAGETGVCCIGQTDIFSEYGTEAGEETNQFIGNITPSCFLCKMNAQGKRLLFLVVKCAWEVDDAMAEKVARQLGVPIFWLCSLLHRARASLEPNRLCLERLNERINAAWVRLRLIEAELHGDTVDGERREKLQKSAAQCRARYRSLLSKKARFRPLVSNRTIAELLRVPKGSVDSGLFYLKACRREKLEEDCAGRVFSPHGYPGCELQPAQDRGAGPSLSRPQAPFPR